MKLLVCGGRDFTDRAFVFACLDRADAKRRVMLLAHGAARGADALADEWAEARGISRLPFPADWEAHGKAAGARRNAEMLAAFAPDGAVAFPGGPGTADMVRRLRAAGVPVWQPTPPVFVFGSNLAGRHGAGAALFAHQHRGAVLGNGCGPQGNAYAIPTKDAHLHPLPLGVIAGHVADFLAYAAAHPGARFELTPVGCGLAGYTPDQIAPMFAAAPANVRLPQAFADLLATSRPVTP